MKLGIAITWPLFRAWWRGMWMGIGIGALAVAWIFRDQWGGVTFKLRFWGNLLLPSAIVLIGIIAGLPDLCTQLADGVRRFRDALERQPHL